jgi:quercetin dioxygenase-like cupin family protein
MNAQHEKVLAVTDMVYIVKRDDIRDINSVEVGGTLHILGEHRDFRRHSSLNRFIPEHGRYSFSWVRLREGEVLDNHEHPTKSMIIVSQGAVYLTGDVEQRLNEGDIVCVPPGKKHGFRTEVGQAFYGLSIQFEGEGLYENEYAPRVEFTTQNIATFHQLQKFNENQLRLHGQNGLFQLFASGALNHDTARRKRFIEALYVWSCCFHKMIYARQALCTDKALLPIYTRHLHEEFGHSELLRTDYQLDGTAYDPILEAASQWFIAKMLSADEAEKVVVVHMVVESSGHIFGEKSKGIFTQKKPIEESYFEIHSEADEDHSAMGLDYLQRRPPSEFPKLLETCRQAWDQMNLVHERIAVMAMTEPLSPGSETSSLSTVREI